MKYNCIILFLTFALVKSCVGQQVSITTLQVKGLSTLDYRSRYVFSYPYFILPDKAIQDSLNLAVWQNNLFIDSIAGLDSNSIKHSLSLAVNYGFMYLSYNEVFASQKLLGIDVVAEAITAYPQSWTIHYLLNTHTGQRYTLGEIVSANNRNSFASKVMTNMLDSLNNYTDKIRKEVKAGQRPSSDLDDMKYYLGECIQHINSSNVMDNTDFFFRQDTLWIEDLCSYPHVVKALEPMFRIPYPAKSIKEFLVPEIYQQLISDKGKQ